jgi:tRNA(Ile)-lysidine synthase
VAPVPVPAPGRYAVPALGLAALVAAPADAPLAWPLLLRTRRPGDRFRPAGGRGSKKLKAWLIDRKVPQARRDRLLLLVDRGGSVLAIPELEARAAALPAGVTVRLVTLP